MPDLRFGGTVDLPTGEAVTWSVADGRRGRRWREVVVRDGSVERATLFETDPSGGVVRLEIGSPAGLLTLHPDAHGIFHGNVVTPGGIRHLSYPGQPGVALFVLGSPAAAAIALGTLVADLDVGASRRVSVLRIDARLEPSLATWDVTRLTERDWRLVAVSSAPSPEERFVRLDERGLVELPGSRAWPLEV